MFLVACRLLEMPSKVSEAAHRILGDLPLHSMDAQRSAAQVAFDLVELEGYGPFQRKVSYPLKELGIRVVTGKNMDDTGFASNGAGIEATTYPSYLSAEIQYCAIAQARQC